MILKKYLQFITESNDGFNSLAEYIEFLAKDNDYAKNVISEFTKDIDADIRIANAVNTLDQHTQELILKMIQDESSEKQFDDEIDVTSYTSLNYLESDQFGGKNIFGCFLKVVSAMGQKNCDIDWKSMPDNFLCFFLTEELSLEELKSVLSRYLYFGNFIKSNQSISNIAKLYYGVTDDLNLEYGILNDQKKYIIGNFPLTKGTYNKILTMDLKSATNLKKFLVGMDLSKLSILSRVKSVMKNYFPGQSDNKLKPTINGDVISYGFEGLGKWDNGVIDSGELDNLKNNLRRHLMSHKWSDKLQFNVTPSNNWVFINIKIK